MDTFLRQSRRCLGYFTVFCVKADLETRLDSGYMFSVRSRWLLDGFQKIPSESGTRILRSISSFSLDEAAAFVVDNGSGMCFAGFLVVSHLVLCSLRLSACFGTEKCAQSTLQLLCFTVNLDIIS